MEETMMQASNLWSALPAIISAVCTLIAAWFAYNQYSKNKKTDAKIEQWKKEEEQKSQEQNYHVTIIYGELWQLLHDLQADRVFILQPHPLAKNLYLTIRLEVRRNGVAPMKHSVQGLQVSEVPQLAKTLVSRDFVYYSDIVSQMKDKKIASLLSANGSAMIAARKLNDDHYDWIGTLVVDYNHPSTISPDTFRNAMQTAASKIQYILPEIKEQRTES